MIILSDGTKTSIENLVKLIVDVSLLIHMDLRPGLPLVRCSMIIWEKEL